MAEIYKGEPIAGDFEGKDILSMDQFGTQDVKILFEEADAIRRIVKSDGGARILDFDVEVNLFYEPSTRTSSSFEAGAYRLGANVVSINNVNYSSVAKGESLADTVRTMEGYGDFTVLRHPVTGSVGEAALAARKPVINAGDGVGEHPTQALLDLYTIRQKLGRLNGLSVTMIGDLKHGRTVHSLSELLSHYDVQLNYVAPDDFQMPEAVVSKNNAAHPGVNQLFTENLDDVLATSDVLYVTRLQRERLQPQTGDTIDARIRNRIEKVRQFGSDDEKKLLTQQFVNAVDAMLHDYSYAEPGSKEESQMYADLYGLFYAIPDVKIIPSNISPTDNPYVITPTVMQRMQERAILMHPLPRVGEITPDCDSDSRAVYFDQVENGMYVRMALMTLIMGKTALLGSSKQYSSLVEL